MNRVIIATPIHFELDSIIKRIQQRKKNIISRKLPNINVSSSDIKYIPHYIIEVKFDILSGLFRKKTKSMSWKIIVNAITGQSATITDEPELKKIQVASEKILSDEIKKEKLVDEIINEVRFSVIAKFRSKPQIKNYKTEKIFRPFWRVEYYLNNTQYGLEKDLEEADKYVIF